MIVCKKQKSPAVYNLQRHKKTGGDREDTGGLCQGATMAKQGGNVTSEEETSIL